MIRRMFTAENIIMEYQLRGIPADREVDVIDVIDGLPGKLKLWVLAGHLLIAQLQVRHLTFDGVCAYDQDTLYQDMAKDIYNNGGNTHVMAEYEAQPGETYFTNKEAIAYSKEIDREISEKEFWWAYNNQKLKGVKIRDGYVLIEKMRFLEYISTRTPYGHKPRPYIP